MGRDAKGVKCIVIGANGLAGRSVAKALTDNRIKWIGTFNKRAAEGLVRLDITNQREVENLFSKFSPDAVFHCANLAGGVDFCESNPDAARAFHLDATKEIGRHCKDFGAALIFISTDYIFDGVGGPYKEDDAPNPLNAYGRLKLAAEEWIKSNLKRYLIIRTTNVYGWDPETVTPNYIMGLYRSLKANRPFNAPSFLYGNPTYALDLASAIIELYTKRASGVFHVVGQSAINRFEWARSACEILGLDFSLVNEVKIPPSNIVPRPLKSLLDANKFTTSYTTVLHDVTDGLKLMNAEFEQHQAVSFI